MKKSEMESHFASLGEASNTIGLMLRQRPIDLSVFNLCVESFSHIVPSLQYWAKEQADGEPLSIVPYRVIDSLGPAFFAHDAIEAMCNHISATRFLKKPEFPFAAMIADIHVRERDALILWTWIEQNSCGEQRLLWQETGISRSSAIRTLDFWVDFGIVLRQPIGNSYGLTFASDLSAPVVGMCPNCGVTGKARREAFYKHRVCQRCGAEVFYHLVQTARE